MPRRHEHPSTGEGTTAEQSLSKSFEKKTKARRNHRKSALPSPSSSDDEDSRDSESQTFASSSGGDDSEEDSRSPVKKSQRSSSQRRRKISRDRFRSRSRSRKSRDPPTDQLKENFVWLLQKLKFLLILGVAGWALTVVALASLVLVSWAFPLLQLLCQILVGAISGTKGLLPFATGISTHQSPSVPSTFCKLPLVPLVMNCRPTPSIATISAEVSWGIETLTQHPDQFFIASSLLDNISANLASLIYQFPMEGSRQLIDDISVLKTMLRRYDDDHDAFLRKIDRTSNSIIRRYDDVVGEAWHKSLSQTLQSWIGERDVWKEFRHDVTLTLDDWTAATSDLNDKAAIMLDRCTDAFRHAKSLYLTTEASLYTTKERQGLWMRMTNPSQHHATINTVDKHLQLLQTLSEAFWLLTVTRGNVDVTASRMNAARIEVATESTRVWDTYEDRSRFNKEVLDGMMDAITASRRAQEKRESLRVAAKSQPYVVTSTARMIG